MTLVTVVDFTAPKPSFTKRDAGGWRREECSHGVSPVCDPRFIANDETIKAHEAQAKVLQMTVEEILECVNDGRSEKWLDYDETDWIEGMYEWTYLCLTDRAVYELLGSS
jgi:hypothetical protein